MFGMSQLLTAAFLSKCGKTWLQILRPHVILKDLILPERIYCEKLYSLIDLGCNFGLDNWGFQ